ncbi:MAG: hypothetical protein MUE51_07400 [Thermoleophilia bacterium]|nr:hypothetical protein [Thermoleophilia bacterium]
MSAPDRESARNPRAEAEARLGGVAARVLEPSPPAVPAGPWAADDPVDPEGAAAPVSPVPGPGPTWAALARDDPALAAWCAPRWLAAWPRLTPPPPGLAATRLALHRLAVTVVSPARWAETGRIGLRWTLGGFGTPFFGDDVQVRVVGARLVVQRAGRARAHDITTLAAAAAAAGVEPGLAVQDQAGAPPPGDLGAPLAVDPAAADWLGGWFGFACSVLEELRAGAPDGGATRVQLWPEHFDLAVELGDQMAGARASVGASPGDEVHPEPYLYVAPWGEVPDDPQFAARGFRGAELTLAALRAAPDQRGRALDFFRAALARLADRPEETE